MQRVLISFLLASLAATTACSSGDDGDDTGLSTSTQSSSIADEAEQIEFLGRYATLPSPVQETEFDIVYHDNSTGRIPGPSDWSIEFAVRIDPADLAKWTDGLTESDAPPEWDERLISSWDVADATPDFYVRSGTTRAVYDDGVVLQVSQTT